MTRAQWLASADSVRMLEFLRGKVGERKLRLYACACCRRVWHLLGDERSRRAVELAERRADGALAEGEEEEAWERAWEAAQEPDANEAARAAWDALGPWETWSHASDAANEAARGAGAREGEVARLSGEVEARAARTEEIVEAAERRAQAALLRDIFGSPFHPASFSPEWRTDTAMSLARQMYESREFGAMPILADALQDAGCDDEAILSHCRDAKQVHVRGCWVVDLALGRE